MYFVQHSTKTIRKKFGILHLILTFQIIGVMNVHKIDKVTKGIQNIMVESKQHTIKESFDKANPTHYQK